MGNGEGEEDVGRERGWEWGVGRGKVVVLLSLDEKKGKGGEMRGAGKDGGRGGEIVSLRLDEEGVEGKREGDGGREKRGGRNGTGKELYILWVKR